MGMLRAILIGRQPRRTLWRVGVLLAVGVLLFLVFNFAVVRIRVEGPSMYPTFRDGEINFINRLAYLTREPRRGEIVGIKTTDKPWILMTGKHLLYVKRIVGLPGESISFTNGQLYVNGEPLREPYLSGTQCDWTAPPRHLGYQEYYFVGDNRSMPYEMHEKGEANIKRILGKALLNGHPVVTNQ